MSQRMSLCIVLEGQSKILLGMKKRGFGAGLWNGFGGKPVDDETMEDAAKRELKEESSITAIELIQRGTLELTFDNTQEDIQIEVFSVREFDGEPVETDEMNPKWFDQKEIPYEEMWAGDKYWLPMMLDGKKFRGTFHFLDEKTLLEYKVEEAV